MITDDIEHDTIQAKCPNPVDAAFANQQTKGSVSLPSRDICCSAATNRSRPTCVREFGSNGNSSFSSIAGSKMNTFGRR